MRRATIILTTLLLAGCSKPAPPTPPAPATASEAPTASEPSAARPGAVPPAPAAAPDLEGFKVIESNDGTYAVAFRQSPDPLPLNDLFDLDVWVLDASRSPVTTAILDVDARMPHHHHGMNLLPGIDGFGDGRFEVSGMRFHMPGYWEIYFDVTLDGLTERAQTSTVLE